MNKLAAIFFALVMLLGTAPAHVATILADGGTEPWAGELAKAIENEQWEQAHELARNILKTEGYHRSGSEAVDWFLTSERGNLLGKVQQETVQEIIAKYGDDALEGIINVGSHARWNNLKFIPGKSDVDFIFVGKHSAEADALFRTKLGGEIGTSAEEALNLTKIGPTSDVRFNQLQEIKTMEDALRKGEDDVATFLKRVNDPQYAEYYKTYGGDKFVENYNWEAGSYDRIQVVDGKTSIIRDPGNRVGSLETAVLGEPTGAMKVLYESKGWKVPEMAASDSWGMATNEYHFMQKEIEELDRAGASASEKATKLAKRAERLSEAMQLTGMDPPAGLVAETQALREGTKFSDEAAEVYLKQVDSLTDATLQRTMKAKIYDDLSRGWHPSLLTGELKGEALEATIKYAEVRKSLDTAMGMSLLGTEKTDQVIKSLNLPDYVENIVRDDLTKAAKLAEDPTKLSQYVNNQAAKKVELINTAEKAGETGKLRGFIAEFGADAGGKIILDSLDAGGRLFMVYDAYKEGGLTGAGNRAMVELGVKLATLKGYEMANPALLAFDVANMATKAVTNAALSEMRNNNVMGIYTGVIPQRQSGWLFIGLGKDVKPDYTSFFEYLNITGMSDDARAQVRSRLDGDKNFENFIKKNMSWVEWASGVSQARREEFKDIYVSQANISYLRSQFYEALQPELERRIASWEKEHGKQFDYENIAEFDKISKQLMADKLGDYRAKYLGEMSYWQATDAQTWQQIEGMMAKDFLASRGIYQEREQERMKQERMKQEMLDFKDKALSWVDKFYASLKGQPVSADTLKKVAKGFGTAKPEPLATSSGGLTVTVSPATVQGWGVVTVNVEMTPPPQHYVMIKVTVKNKASGAEDVLSLTQAMTDTSGKYSTAMGIDEGNKKNWLGENLVTVETEPLDGSDKQTATAGFKVLDMYKIMVTTETAIVIPGSELTVNVEISPPLETELAVECPDPLVAPTSPLKTGPDGRKEFTISVRPPTAIEKESQGLSNVQVTARVPEGDDYTTILGEADVVIVYPKVDFDFALDYPDHPSQLVEVGDIIYMKIRWVYLANFKLVVNTTVRNSAGYSQSFQTKIGGEGYPEVRVGLLEITPDNMEVWAGVNEVTVKVRPDVPGGEKATSDVKKELFGVREPKTK